MALKKREFTPESGNVDTYAFQRLSGRCAATTCGNGGESCNVARQSGVVVVDLRCFKVIYCRGLLAR